MAKPYPQVVGVGQVFDLALAAVAYHYGWKKVSVGIVALAGAMTVSRVLANRQYDQQQSGAGGQDLVSITGTEGTGSSDAYAGYGLPSYRSPIHRMHGLVQLPPLGALVNVPGLGGYGLPAYRSPIHRRH